MMDIKTVFFIVDIVALAFLGIAVLFGLIRGMDKTIHKIVISLIGLVFVLVAVTPITNKILTSEVSGEKIIETYNQAMQTEYEGNVEITNGVIIYSEETYSVKGILEGVITAQLFDGQETSAASGMADLISGLASCIIKIIVYIVLLIVSIFIKIIAKIILAILRKILHIKIKRRRHLLGAVMGIVRYAVTFVAIFLPLYGLVGYISNVGAQINEYQYLFVSSNTQDQDEDYVEYEIKHVDYTTSEENTSDSDNVLLEVYNAYQTSIVKKYMLTPVSKVFAKNDSIDQVFIGKTFFEFKVDGEKVNLKTEISYVLNVLPTVAKVYDIIDQYNETGKLNLSNLEEGDLLVISDCLRKSKLITELVPMLMSATTKMLGESEYVSEETLAALQEVDWADEISNIAYMIEYVAEFTKLEDIDELAAHPLPYILGNETANEIVCKIAKKVADSKLIIKVMIPFAIDAMEKSADSSTDEANVLETINFDSIRQIDFKQLYISFVDIFSVTGKYYRELQTTGAFDSDVNVVVLLSTYNDTLVKLTNDVFAVLSETSTLTDDIIPLVFDIMNSTTKLSAGIDTGITTADIYAIDWKEDISSFKDLTISLLTAVKNLNLTEEDLANPINILGKEGFVDEAKVIVKDFVGLHSVSEIIIPLIVDSTFATADLGETFEGLDAETIKGYLTSEEIEKLADIAIEAYQAYVKLDVDKDNPYSVIENEDLYEIVSPVASDLFESELVTNLLLPLFIKNFKESLGKSENITTDIYNVMVDMVTVDKIKVLLTTDLENVIGIVQELYKAGIVGPNATGLTDLSEEKLAALKKVATTVFELNIIKGQEARIVNMVLSSSDLQEQLSQYGIVLDVENVTDWGQEASDIIDLIGYATSLDLANLNMSELTSDEDKITIAKQFLIELANLQSLYDSFPNMLVNIINNSLETNITLTDAEIAQVKANGYEKEINALIDTIVYSTKCTYTDEMIGEEYYNLMMIASDGIISTKLIGSIASSVGFVGSYDLSTPAALRAAAPFVKAGCNFSYVLANRNSLDLNDEEVYNKFVESTETLFEDESLVELTNNFFTYLMGSEMSLTSSELTDMSSTIKAGLTEYQNSSDQANFSYYNLSDEIVNKVAADKTGILVEVFESLFPVQE